MLVLQSFISRIDISPACASICGRGFRRPHLMCLGGGCRERRWHCYDLDRTQYLKTGHLIIPKRGKFVILFKSKHRRYVKLKELVLKVLLTICSWCLD